MKIFKNIVIITILCTSSSVFTKKSKPTQQLTKPKVTTTQTYSSILQQIRNNKPRINIVKEGKLTEEFINFVTENATKAQLSYNEREALLQAGANIYTQWSDDPEENESILEQLNSQIQNALEESKEELESEELEMEKEIKTEKETTPEKTIDSADFDSIINEFLHSQNQLNLNRAYSSSFSKMDSIKLLNQSKLITTVGEKIGKTEEIKNLLIIYLTKVYGTNLANGTPTENAVNQLWKEHFPQ